MEAPRAVLFDMDGVLIASYEAWFRLVNAAARHFSMPDITPERFEASWGQGADADLRDFFAGRKLEEIERFYEKHLLDYGEHIRADAQARDVLLDLRQRGYLRGVITNTPTFLARDLLAWTGLIGLVDITVGAGGDVRSKPDPDVIQRASEALQVQPHEVVVVADSGFDEKAAEAAGVRFLGFRIPSKLSVQSLAEIPRWLEQRGS